MVLIKIFFLLFTLYTLLFNLSKDFPSHCNTHVIVPFSEFLIDVSQNSDMIGISLYQIAFNVLDLLKINPFIQVYARVV